MIRTPLACAVAAVLAATALGTAAAGPVAESNTEAGWQVSALPISPGQPYSFSEPGIATGAKHVVVVNACTANANLPSTYWRSTDGGQHWTAPFTIGGSAIGCGDSDVAIGADGYEYALTLGTGVAVYRSRDGRHWTGPAQFPPPHGDDQPDRPWLLVDPARPAVVHLFNSEIGGNIVEWTSTDHGANFAGPVAVTGGINSQAALALGSRPLIDPAHPEEIYLYYETASLAALAGTATATAGAQAAGNEFPLSQLWEASSRDGGRHWSNRLVLDVRTAFDSAGTLGHLLPAATVGRDGTRHIALSVRLGSGTATHLFLLHSHGAGWSAPVRVDRGFPSNVMPALAVSAAGHVYLSWYASAAANFSSSDARWDEVVATCGNALAVRPRCREVRLNGSRPVHVGAIETAGAIGNDIRENWALRDFQSITVDPAGRPLVVWAADFAGQTRTYAAFRRAG